MTRMTHPSCASISLTLADRFDKRCQLVFSKPSVQDSRECLAGRSLRSWPLSLTGSAWWPTIIPVEQSESQESAGRIYPAGVMAAELQFCFASTGRAPARPCPGWETAFSSLHRLLSGGKRSCWVSICTALILQPRGPSPFWARGQTLAHLPGSFTAQLPCMIVEIIVT